MQWLSRAMLRLHIENTLDRKEIIMILSDLGIIVTGKTPSTKKPEFWNGNIPFVTPKDIQGTKHILSTERKITSFGLNSVKGAILPKGAICVSCIGNIGYVGKTITNCISNQQINSIVPSENTNSDYVFYLMKWLWPYFKNYEGQSTALSILNKSQFSKIEIPCHSRKQQDDIANILNNIDDRIELNNAINNNLEQQAQAIYQQMFIDNARSDWAEGTLSDIADITMGQSPSGSSYNEDGTGTIFFQGRAEFGFRFPSVRLYTTEPKRMARSNDTLMSVRAPVGDLNVAHTDCCIGRGLAAIHSKSNHQSFVLYTMFSLKKQLDVFNGEGTVFGSINRNSLNDMPILIPSDDILDEFERIVAPMDLTIRNNYDENCRLQDIRDTLLPCLMSGELDVSDIDL